VSVMTETAETYLKPIPATDALTAPYWKAAAEGRLLIQRCEPCGCFQFYPRAHCTKCGALDPAWHEASGRGVVHTFSVIHRNGSPGFDVEVPYVFAIVELEEGPRMTANVIGIDPEEVVVDMPVQVTFTKVSDEIAIPQFTKAG
jgi:uncharacterized OB-fold protein